MRNPNQERSRRFTSEKNAKDFAKTVQGELKDLRNNENRKSDFKVTYTKENARKGMNDYDSDYGDYNDDKGNYQNYDDTSLENLGGPIPEAHSSLDD